MPINIDPEASLNWFIGYHKKHRHIYAAFEEIALTATKHRNHFSARTVIELVRWNSMVSAGKGEEYKVSDHVIPYYARMFMFKFPEHEGFFRLKTNSLSQFDALLEKKRNRVTKSINGGTII